jgi:hypothetical protein
VNRHTVPHFGYAAEFRRRHNAISRPDQSEREGPLAPGNRAGYDRAVVARALVRYLVGGFLISLSPAFIG